MKMVWSKANGQANPYADRLRPKILLEVRKGRCPQKSRCIPTSVKHSDFPDGLETLLSVTRQT